jgi:hypothetical protein
VLPKSFEIAAADVRQIQLLGHLRPGSESPRRAHAFLAKCDASPWYGALPHYGVHRPTSIYIIRRMAAAIATVAPLIWKHAPTPTEIDEIAAEYFGLESKVDTAYRLATELDAPFEDLKERCILAVEEHGQPHATKSRILIGIKSELVATFGISSSIDSAAVDRFRMALQAAGRTRILGKIFEERITFTLRPEAAGLLRREQMSDQLTALFARCAVMKARTPTLQVRGR